MPDRMVLLNPGPVNISERVRKALATPDMCHREEEFYRLQAAVRAKLLQVFGLDPKEYASVLFTASGTAAVEACVSRFVSPAGTLLVVSNGVYGERICDIARRYGTKVLEVKCDYTSRPNLETIARALREEPRIEAIAAVHHETTTGLINPIREIGEIARDRKVPLFVDAISGLAGEELHFVEANVAACAGTANKCIQGLPGICFVIIRRSEIERMAKIPARNVYLDLVNQFRKQEANDTPFTPAVQVMSAFNEALTELLEETVPARIERYRFYSRILREGYARLGLKTLLPPDLLSNTITSLRLPEEVKYEPVHDFLKARGFIIYAGQGQLRSAVFRIANMGVLKEEELRAFLAALEEAIRSLRAS
ncbi:MAG: 2-aminoethylphosphonate aminotransferase [Planctomycetota bacterium]|nr:2-aminoethylphosphonate aminotransferase [Planctomycetota bacterium]